jgi:TonB family protein
MTRYARFDPALDSAGNPTTGQFSTRVRWVPAFDRNFSNRQLEWSFPKEARQQKAKGMVSIQFKVAPDGRVFDCRVTASSGFPVLDEATCTNTEKLKGSRAVEPSEFVSKPRVVRRVVEWK